MTKRWISLALAGLMAFALVADAAVGIYQRATCTSLVSPETGKTYCFEETTNVLKRWNGSAWETVPTSILTGTVTGTYTLGGTPTFGATFAGNLLFTDNLYDIGASGATRPRDLFLGRNLTMGGNLVVSGAGPHAIGGATNAAIRLLLTGTFSPAAQAQGTNNSGTLAPGIGADAFGFVNQVTLNKAASGTHGDFVGAFFDAPTIGAGAATLTNASTLKITSAPTGATNNFALWVETGRTNLGGALLFTGDPVITPGPAVKGNPGLHLVLVSGGTSGILFHNQTNTAERMRLTDGGILALGTTVTTGAAVGDLVSTKGWTTEAAGAAHGNAAANAVTIYIREDIDVGAGTATADCAIRARKSDGIEVNIVTLVTDGGCP